ncbi:MAG: ATP-binding cassette domain-containing protein [Holosporales bacterium]|jgi:polar amino acid transport system ATP-binding protein|nr:ATP-binding cassette domain-containing protein [Holosporales bacterium]
MLKICNVSKYFNDVKVLDEISLHVTRASIVGLAGHSGSGKSTLLRCIQGLETPESGHVDCCGKIGFMFQDFQLFPHMTVLRNLVYAPTLKKKTNKMQSIAKAEALLNDLGINEKKDAYPESLSGGQKQRVALARSLMIDPDVMVCDEPTSGLDIATTNDVSALLKRVNKLNVTIIVASHDLDFLIKLCDRIVLLKFGKITTEVSPSQHAETSLLLKSFYDSISN